MVLSTTCLLRLFQKLDMLKAWKGLSTEPGIQSVLNKWKGEDEDGGHDVGRVLVWLPLPLDLCALLSPGFRNGHEVALES